VGSTILYKDGKVRTEKGTQAAVDALGIIDQLGGMVALGIGAFGHHKHALGAKLDAETASLAALLDDLNHAARDLDMIPIQGLSPIAHGFLLGSVPIVWSPAVTWAANWIPVPVPVRCQDLGVPRYAL
jgi:hypothetical protein